MTLPEMDQQFDAEMERIGTEADKRGYKLETFQIIAYQEFLEAVERIKRRLNIE